jgi:CTP-dependent riboflavin kinase
MEKLPERIGGLPISYRAFGILVFSALTGIKISCERLMKRGSEGRDATARAMQELSEHGLIHTTSLLVEGRWRRGTMITEKGREYLESIGLDIYSFKLRGKTTISELEQDC